MGEADGAAFLRAGGDGGLYGIHGRLSRAGIGNRSSTRLRPSGMDKRRGRQGSITDRSWSFEPRISRIFTDKKGLYRSSLSDFHVEISKNGDIQPLSIVYIRDHP